MKRDRNKIVYNETGIFKVNQVSVRYLGKFYEKQTGSYVRALQQSSYHICNIYTDQNTVLSSYQKLNGEQATNQVFLDPNDVYIPFKYRNTIRKKIRYNDHFNCHGFTFLDGQFWFELDAEMVNIIIEDDAYHPCSFEDLLHNGISLFYDYEGYLIHSGRMVNGHLLSKFGINHVMTIGIEEILHRYKDIDHSRTRYFNAAE